MKKTAYFEEIFDFLLGYDKYFNVIIFGKQIIVKKWLLNDIFIILFTFLKLIN